MEKQLDFEQKRIYIKEVNQKDMIISGGSQFNWLSIIDDNQPLTIPAPIKPAPINPTLFLLTIFYRINY